MSEKQKDYKTISLTPEAKEKLGNVGRKNETWSEVVLRLVEHYKKCKEEKT